MSDNPVASQPSVDGIPSGCDFILIVTEGMAELQSLEEVDRLEFRFLEILTATRARTEDRRRSFE